jgi:hypothetical protein
MIVVPAIVAKYKMPRLPKVVRASWEITVSSSEGIAPISPSRKVSPMNKPPRMVYIQTIVMTAL